MLDPARLVFLDETAANTKIVRLSGRYARGERLIGRGPRDHWKTITFVAALRRNGMRAARTVLAQSQERFSWPTSNNVWLRSSGARISWSLITSRHTRPPASER